MLTSTMGEHEEILKKIYYTPGVVGSFGEVNNLF